MYVMVSGWGCYWTLGLDVNSGRDRSVGLRFFPGPSVVRLTGRHGRLTTLPEQKAWQRRLENSVLGLGLRHDARWPPLLLAKPAKIPPVSAGWSLSIEAVHATRWLEYGDDLLLAILVPVRMVLHHKPSQHFMGSLIEAADSPTLPMTGMGSSSASS